MIIILILEILRCINSKVKDDYLNHWINLKKYPNLNMQIWIKKPHTFLWSQMPSKIVRENFPIKQNNLDLNYKLIILDLSIGFFKKSNLDYNGFANMAYVHIHNLKLNTTSTLFQIHPINDERSRKNDPSGTASAGPSTTIHVSFRKPSSRLPKTILDRSCPSCIPDFGHMGGFEYQKLQKLKNQSYFASSRPLDNPQLSLENKQQNIGWTWALLEKEKAHLLKSGKLYLARVHADSNRFSEAKDFFQQVVSKIKPAKCWKPSRISLVSLLEQQDWNGARGCLCLDTRAVEWFAMVHISPRIARQEGKVEKPRNISKTLSISPDSVFLQTANADVTLKLRPFFHPKPLTWLRDQSSYIQGSHEKKNI